eukprot:9558802-Alexandrium_andersonii.AAC.1
MDSQANAPCCLRSCQGELLKHRARKTTTHAPLHMPCCTQDIPCQLLTVGCQHATAPKRH